MSWKSELEAWWKDQKASEIGGQAKHSQKAKPARQGAINAPNSRAVRSDRSGHGKPSSARKKAKRSRADRESLQPLGFSELRYQSDHRVQFADTRGDAPRLQMIVGLDFGTSYTKVVLGESRVRYAVPMQEQGVGVDRYTAPARLSVSSDGRCHIGEVRLDDRIFNDLKLALLRREFTAENKACMTAYLALMLRHARGWLLTEKREVYQGTSFDWFVNLGLPTNSALDNELEEAYRSVTLAAWRLSGREQPITLDGAKDALSLPESEEPASLAEGGWCWLHPDAIRAFPEFAAQVSAYVMSPMRAEDLHALIDIGGGTIDVTLFNVVVDREENSHKYPIFARRVVNLGTRFLVEERLVKLGGDQAWNLGPQDPVPTTSEMAKALGVSRRSLEKADTEFKRRVQDAWGGEFRYAKSTRYSTSRTWQEGLPVFVSGGGAGCDFYQAALKALFPPKAQWRTKKERLPLPDSLEAPVVTDETFGRLAVAYGLSFDEADLGEIIRPENILDDRPDESAGERRREALLVGKEMT